MIPTVQKGLRLQPIPQDEFAAWSQKELIPFLSQVRQGLNYIGRVQATFQTDGSGGLHTVWTSADVAVGQAITLTAYVMGIETGGTQRGTKTIVALFGNDGTFAQTGATTALYTNNAPGYVIQFTVVANHVELQVQDAGNTTNWVAVVDCLEATAP